MIALMSLRSTVVSLINTVARQTATISGCKAVAERGLCFELVSVRENLNVRSKERQVVILYREETGILPSKIGYFVLL